MNRRILALVFGFVILPACGDNAARVIDAPSVDAAMIDAAADAPPDTPRNPLILSYDFEENSTVVKDTSGRGLDGTLNDVAAWTTSGRNGGGLALLGGNPAPRFVSLPSGIFTGVDDFTISVWVNLNSVGVWARIFDFGNGKAPPDPGERFMFMTVHGFTPGTADPPNADDGVHATSFSPAAETFVGAQTLLPVGVWKHIALTGSGGDRQLYIDGYPVGSVSGGASVPPSEMEPLSPNSWLGRSRFQSFGDPGLDGTIDEFKIYNKVLTRTEIAELASPQHDYSYWRFDESSGTTAKDSSENAIPTVIANGPTWVAGRLGGALDFPGGAPSTNGPHVVLASPPLASCTTQLTVATWVKLHSQDDWARVFDFGTRNGAAITSFIFLTLHDVQPQPMGQPDKHGMHFAMVSPSGPPNFDMATPEPPVPADDQWHHVAVTVAGDGLVTMYVDGTVVLTQQNTTNVKVSDFAATTQNYLGKSQFEATDAYLHAALDELRISCRAFTADEIKNLAHK